MRRRLPYYVTRLAALLAFTAAFLLCAGALAAQPGGTDAGGGHEASAVTDGAAPGGSHLPGPVEAPDSEDVHPAGSERLTTLVLGFFLVSIALLSGAGLVGRAAGRRLERLRLPAVTPTAPAREPLSLLEVLRL